MKTKSFIFSQVFVLFVCSFCVFSQTQSENSEDINFGYSKNPPAKAVQTDKKSDLTGNEDAAIKKIETRPDTSRADVKYESVARMTREAVKDENRKSLKPTEIYKVGSGDVLFIGIQESRSNYYTVLSDGSIDYPLAGGLVPVDGLTVEEIEGLLQEKIQLYEEPEVSVKVREYGSHAIDIVGLADRKGRHYLQREAMPLYVLRAQALARREVDITIVKRQDGEELRLMAGTGEFDDTLIFPGDVIEFASSAAIGNTTGYVYIGGTVAERGRFGYHEGMTLTQAIMAAGGTVSGAKKAVVRRKNEKGFLESVTYKLNDIKKGKKIDPVLEAGDMIEVGN